MGELGALFFGPRIQVIWWWRHWAVGFKRLSLAETDLARIYSWTLCVGPLEVRRWTKEVARG